MVNGHYYLTKTEEYRKAAECYEKAFDMINKSNDYFDSVIFAEQGNIKWCYYNTACAWALSGESERAFSCLQKAVEAGWKDLDFINKDVRLNCLKDNSRWTDFLKFLS